jgi:hypothetical protein
MQAILPKARNWRFAQIEPCWAVCSLISGTPKKTVADPTNDAFCNIANPPNLRPQH